MALAKACAAAERPFCATAMQANMHRDVVLTRTALCHSLSTKFWSEPADH
jgi:hypothetical protein